MTSSDPIFRHRLVVPDEAVDENGHVNNVVYVQWMQEVAVRHSEASGGSRAMRTSGGSWVVRTHRIEYLSPAFAGDELEAATWVADFRRVRSLRKYRFTRVSDSKLITTGETDWVFVDAHTGRPRAIPEEVARSFSVHPETPDSPE